MSPLPSSPSKLRNFLRRRFSREEVEGLSLTVGFLVCAGLVVLFGILADEIFEVGGRDPFDRRVTLAVRSLQTPGRNAMARAVTILGSAQFLAPATIAVVAVLLWQRRRVSALLFAGSVVGGWLLEILLKISFHRSRPDLWPALVVERTASFPSGHATMSAVFFGGIAALVCHLSRSRPLRAAASVGSAAIVLAVGWTRVYLGAHWATDVAGGFLVGLFWVVVSSTATEYFARRGQARPGR